MPCGIMEPGRPDRMVGWLSARWIYPPLQEVPAPAPSPESLTVRTAASVRSFVDDPCPKARAFSR
jgi:hypothetical protein